jgi:hypothetical protein
MGGTGGKAGSAGTESDGGEGGTAILVGGASGKAGKGGAGGKAGSGSGGKGGASGGGSGEGGESGTAGAGGSTPKCDPTQSPSEDECVIDEDYGVFVSPNGSDGSGDGSRSKPYATLGKAISKAEAKGKRVYACADGGAYHEALHLDATASGLELYGGFSCDKWAYSTTAKSTVTSSTTLSLHVEGVTNFRVEDFRFEAADGVAPGESSMGALIASSTNVVLRRVHLDAGTGVNGSNGTRTDFVFPDRVDLDGKSTTTSTGASPKLYTCPGGAMTSGGSGGTAQPGGQNGGNGAPDFAGPGGEGGDLTKACNMGGGGSNGSTTPPLTPAAGASTLGALTSSGWTAASGTNGPDGPPGQGGGGGASSPNGGGGGGGAGGCGGAGGKAGQGGGASIALAVFESAVTLDHCELAAADAGKGGNGIAGQTGQMESGFAGNGTLGGCQGGVGGLGGDGVPSGAGAGGISVGIIWKGDAAPTQSGLTVTTGTAGAKGIGGDPGMNDGVDGVAQEVLKTP